MIHNLIRKCRPAVLGIALVLLICPLMACEGNKTSGKTAAPEASATADTGAGPLAPLEVSVNVMESDLCGSNAKADFVAERFGIRFKYIPSNRDDWYQTVKKWVSSGDMPDLVWWDLKGSNFADYQAWAKSGAFRSIPADQLKAQPELNKLYTALKSIKALTIGGKLYAWPAARNAPKALQNASSDVWIYRRDWAKAVGLFREGDRYTFEEWAALCNAVLANDPGSSGAGNTAVLVMDSPAYPTAPVLSNGPAALLGAGSGYAKGTDGNYAWVPSLPEYRAGVQMTFRLYHDGVIWKDCAQFKDGDAENLFAAGSAFARYAPGSSSINGDVSKMLKNRIIQNGEDIGIPIITYDGKLCLASAEDYCTATAFSSKVEDGKLERVLMLWNYLNSSEGRLLQWLGLKDKDYALNDDGSVKILWQKDGVEWVNPYSKIRTNEFTMAGLLPDANPADPPYGARCSKQLQEYISKNGTEIQPFDYSVSFFSAPNKNQNGAFEAACRAELIELLQACRDEEEMGVNWDAWVQSMEPQVRNVLEEINNGIK